MKLVKVENYGCNPCKTMDLILKDLNVEDYEKINISDNEEFMYEYDIMRVPTLLLMDENNIVVDRVAGIEDIEEIVKLVNRTILDKQEGTN